MKKTIPVVFFLLFVLWGCAFGVSDKTRKHMDQAFALGDRRAPAARSRMAMRETCDREAPVNDYASIGFPVWDVAVPPFSGTDGISRVCIVKLHNPPKYWVGVRTEVDRKIIWLYPQNDLFMAAFGPYSSVDVAPDHIQKMVRDEGLDVSEPFAVQEIVRQDLLRVFKDKKAIKEGSLTP